MRDYRHYYIPPQKISMSQKTEEWRKQCVDAIQNLASFNRDSKKKKHVNKDLHQGKVNVDDYQHILDPLELKGKFGGVPARIQNQGRMRFRIERLKGEELRRPDNFRVVAVNGEALSVKERKMKEKLMEAMNQFVLQELGLDEEGNPPQTPEEIAKYFKYEYTDPREVTANQVLKYLRLKEKFRRKFSEGFENALVVAEEVYYAGIVSGDPKLRVVDSKNFDYDKNPEDPFIQNGQWAKEERWMTVGSILDEMGEYLKEEDIERLDTGQIGQFSRAAQPGYAYPFKDTGADGTGSMYGGDMYDSQGNPEGHVYVCNVVWKSMRKIGFVLYIDESGNPQEIMVDEDFKLTAEQKKEGWELEWQWINEVWQGTKIGTDIYVNIGPLPNQCRSMTNPSECSLPYIGCVYNGGISMIDLMKPNSYLYDMLWCKLEMELAKAKGQTMIIDISQKPKDWPMEKWFYYMDNLGLLIINPLEEGNEKGDRSNFNQYQVLDRGMSKTVVQYVQFMDKLDSLMGDLVGVNAQRLGDTSPSETLGGIQSAIQNSSYVTEPWFFLHNELKEAVMTYMLELAKLAYIDGKTIQFFVDDIYTEMLKIEGEIFNDSDFGVFVSDSSKDTEVKQNIIAMAQAALQNQQAKFSDLVAIFKSDSISEMESRLINSERATEQAQQQTAQADRDMQQQINESQLQAAKEREDREDMRLKMKLDNDLTKAQITALGFNENKDTNSNNVLDVLEIQKLMQKDKESGQKMQLEREKLAANQANDSYRIENEAIMQDKQIQLKEKELAIKKQALNKPKPKK